MQLSLPQPVSVEHPLFPQECWHRVFFKIRWIGRGVFINPPQKLSTLGTKLPAAFVACSAPTKRLFRWHSQPLDQGVNRAHRLDKVFSATLRACVTLKG